MNPSLLLVVAALATDVDQIRLEFLVRDQDVHRLARPVLHLMDEATGDLAVPLVDDGSLPEDTAGDGVWTGVTTARRVPRLQFTLSDEATGATLGTHAALLPAAPQARLVLRTVAREPGTVLESAAGNASSDDPDLAGPTPAAPPATEERFVYVLWVVLLVGLLGLGWLRVVVRRLYLEDFLPTWKKLDRWLDRELER